MDPIINKRDKEFQKKKVNLMKDLKMWIKFQDMMKRITMSLKFLRKI